MLNYLWGIMIIIGVIYAALTGNISAVADGALDSSKEAVSLCITMLGVMSLWTGLMQIAQNSGLIRKCMHAIRPAMCWMFPSIDAESEAMQHMTTNVIANILGLGWAATPAGIKAMQSLKKESELGEIASNEMCTFLIINISSLQLIPVNIIAYRSQYGSVNPTAIVGPGIVATLCSTLVAIIFCKVMIRKKQR